MSQMTASTGPAPRPPRRAAGSPPLRLVRGEPRRSSSPVPFVLLCSVALLAGLIALLLLNTALVNGSYQAHSLETRSAVLAENEEALRERLAALSGPAGLAVRAAELGMVQPAATRWIDLSTGAVSGVQAPATDLNATGVVIDPSMARVTAPDAAALALPGAVAGSAAAGGPGAGPNDGASSTPSTDPGAGPDGTAANTSRSPGATAGSTQGATAGATSAGTSTGTSRAAGAGSRTDPATPGRPTAQRTPAASPTKPATSSSPTARNQPRDGTPTRTPTR